mgnify:FL=1
MKKLIITAAAISVIAFGGSAAHAQSDEPVLNPDVSLPLPLECSEQDVRDELGSVDTDGDGIVDNCQEFYTDSESLVPGLDVSGFLPVCQLDAPYIQYNIIPIDFEPTEPIQAKITLKDVNGNTVNTFTVNSLSGRFLYPGASVGPDGKGTDWPGWTKNSDGFWVPDNTDTILRAGLTIIVELNPVAVAQVNYVPDDSACANPPTGSLPRTGSGTSLPLQIGAILLVAGGITLVATKRRSAAVAS